MLSLGPNVWAVWAVTWATVFPKATGCRPIGLQAREGCGRSAVRGGCCWSPLLQDQNSRIRKSVQASQLAVAHIGGITYHFSRLNQELDFFSCIFSSYFSLHKYGDAHSELQSRKSVAQVYRAMTGNRNMLSLDEPFYQTMKVIEVI